MFALAAALLLLLPTLTTATVIMLGPTPEEVVEGHTVFTVIEPTLNNSTGGEAHFAAAVAVLVREFHQTSLTRYTRFPGVLWFNDQYLVQCGESGLDKSPACDSTKTSTTKTVSYPCGAVLAVRQNDPDPRNLTYTQSQYVETYLITDPNNIVWNVDKWNESGEPVWTVSLGGNGFDATYNDTSPGSTCGSRSGQGFTYNAVLYFELDDLVITGRKDHGNSSSPDASDTNGCQANAYNPNTAKYDYPCPQNNDDKEGNSHPFNPGNEYPLQNSTARGNHGGSADCNGDGQPDLNCHATARVDIYYGGVPAPTSRRYPHVHDVEGSSAPYDCEPSIKICNEAEAMAATQT